MVDKLVLKLEGLSKSKQGLSLKKQKKLIKKQLILIEVLDIEEEALRNLVKRELEKIKNLEKYKEYNLSYDEYYQLIRDKDVERNFAHLFSEEFQPLINIISLIIKNLKRQLWSNRDINRIIIEEEELYQKLNRLLEELELSQEKIKDYFEKLKGLTYKKGAIRSGQIIAKVIRGILFKVDIQGIGNIPAWGPCIIASHHYHGYFDTLLLYSIFKRNVFFLASIENFIALPLWDKVICRLGALPFKQDESRFPKRKSDAPSIDKIQNYPSNNFKTMKKLLFHLSIGDAVFIYPEGEAKTLTIHEWDPSLRFFPPQEGYVQLAVLAERKTNRKIPIIPIGIKYSGKLNRNLRIRIGKPILLPNQIQKLSGSKMEEAIKYYSMTIFEVIKRLSG
ncbi:MAG: 1-acyl-sn-glycerol-3-phosphate acyltransferase [Candidatus Woesearchaeota archaeon]